MNEHLLYAERYVHISLSPHYEAGSIFFLSFTNMDTET